MQSLAKWIYNIMFMIDDILFAFIAAQTNLMPIHQKISSKSKMAKHNKFLVLSKITLNNPTASADKQGTALKFVLLLPATLQPFLSPYFK